MESTTFNLCEHWQHSLQMEAVLPVGGICGNIKLP